tara:strand:+ start:399 stop:674 length:276 start_codon:yes stop_codon:yes gene_type:complete
MKSRVPSCPVFHISFPCLSIIAEANSGENPPKAIRPFCIRLSIKILASMESYFLFPIMNEDESHSPNSSLLRIGLILQKYALFQLRISFSI